MNIEYTSTLDLKDLKETKLSQKNQTLDVDKNYSNQKETLKPINF